MVLGHYMSFTQLRDAAEDLAMWSFKEFKLIVRELEDWDPTFNRIPMKKITKKSVKSSGIASKNWFGSHSGGESH